VFFWRSGTLCVPWELLRNAYEEEPLHTCRGRSRSMGWLRHIPAREPWVALGGVGGLEEDVDRIELGVFDGAECLGELDDGEALDQRSYAVLCPEDLRIRGTADAVLQVPQGVAHSDEGSAGRKRPSCVREESLHCGGIEVYVDDQHEVELAVWHERRHVCNDPINSGVSSDLSRLLDSGRGEIDAGDVPTIACQPDGIAALTAREIKSGSSREPFDYWRKEQVWLRRPHEILLLIPRIPGVTIHVGNSKGPYAKMYAMDDTWDPITVAEAVGRFEPFDVDWWIAGGLAIDLFLGWESRPHADIDIEMFRKDRDALFDVFDGWELFSMSEGSLTRWLRGDPIASAVFAIWGRPHDGASWAVEILLADGDRSEWKFRRDPTITLDGGRLVRATENGVPCCTPEVQLLYKSKMARPKDDVDLAHCLHRMDKGQRSWLRDAISRTTPDHPWIEVLEASLHRLHE
jgi:hypothetical protein